MSLSYAVRPKWLDLPKVVRTAIEDKVGARVVAASSPVGGFTEAMAGVLELATGTSVFVKAVGPDHPRIAAMMSAEQNINEALPAPVPAPTLLCALQVEGWSVLVFETVAGRHPDLSPQSADLPRVVQALDVLSGTRAPGGVPGAAVEFTGWRRSGAWPERADELAGWEERCSMAGDVLVHADLRADNMIVSSERVLVVDWASAAAGAPWVDPAYVCAQLVVSGHTPGAAEQAVSGLPVWKAADPEEVTAFAVGLCGIWENTDGGLPPELRAYRSRAAVAGRSWIRHRLGWA